MVNPFKDYNARKLYKILGYSSLVIVIVSASYGIIASIIKGVEVVGQTFVDVEFPPIHVFPMFYMKPITWLTLSIITLVYCTLEMNKERIANFPEFTISLVKVIAFVVGSLSIYEVLFNFTLWSGLIASGEVNPDLIINPFPNPEIPWNIVFATKIYFTMMVVSVYSFYFLNRLERRERNSS